MPAKRKATDGPSRRKKMSTEQKRERDARIEAHSVIKHRLFRGDLLSLSNFNDLINNEDKIFVFFYRKDRDIFPEVVRPFHRGEWINRWHDALVLGRIWEPTAEWEEGMGSDVWSEIVALEYGHERIDIRVLHNLRTTVPGVQRGYGMAFYPYFNDTQLDLSFAQIYQRENYPSSHLHCLQQTLLMAKEHMGDELAFEEKHVQSVLLKYFKGGAAGGSEKIPSSKLGRIARDLACKFRVTTLGTYWYTDSKGVKSLKRRMNNSFVVPNSQEFGTEIPVGLISDHIFFDKPWPSITGQVDLCIQAGLEWSIRSVTDERNEGKQPWSTMKIIHRLTSKFGKLLTPIPPDVSRRINKAEFLSSTVEFDSTVDFTTVEQDNDDADMEIHGSQRLYTRLNETKHPKPTHFYAADTETYAKEPHSPVQASALPISDAIQCKALPYERHQLYMIALQHFLDSSGQVIPTAEVTSIPVFSTFKDALGFIENRHREESLNERKEYKERKYWSEKKDRKKDDFSLKVVLYFHNLKFDKAVIQSECKIYSCCEKGGHVYEFTVLLPESRILVCCRDSYKHISQPISSFPKAFQLPPNVSKKEQGIIYEYFSPEKRGLKTTPLIYACSTPRFPSDSDASYLAKRMSNEAAVLRACADLGVEVSHDEEFKMHTFVPDDLYRRYLQYDVLTLAEGLKIYRMNMLRVYSNVVGVDEDQNIPEPLTKLTSSAFSRLVFEHSGATEGMFQYRTSLRRYIMSSVRGGRCTPHPAFHGKEVPQDVYYFDGVSLYPSSFVQQVKLAGGFPKGPAFPLTPEQREQGIHFLSSPIVSYAIVTIRITSIPRKLVFTPPIIAYKNPNDPAESLQYIQDLPNGEPFELTVGLIDLFEYIGLHAIEFSVLHGCYWSQEYGVNAIVGEVMTKFHEIRKRHKPKGPEPNDALSNAYKLCSNSIYGTTIMKPSDSTSEFWDMDDMTEDNLPLKLMNIFDSIQEVLCLGKSLQVKREFYDDAFTFCLIGSIVLSRSRWIMNGLWAACERVGAYIFYTDTDSVWIPKDKLPAIETEYNEERECRSMPPLIGGELCQFHNDIDPKSFGSLWQPTYNADHIFATSMFIVARKVYLLKTAYITPEGHAIRGLSYKCKGLPKDALEWYCPRLPPVTEFKHLDDEYNSFSQYKSFVHFYRDIICGVAHEVPLNPTSVRFFYDKRRFVFTSHSPICRTIASKLQRVTFHGGSPTMHYTPANENENEEEAIFIAEKCRSDLSTITASF